MKRLVLTSMLVLSTQARAELTEGVQMPDGAHKVGEHRYRLPGNFEETMKYFKSVYPAVAFPRTNIANQPGVKALHLQNSSGHGWEGLNIYETGDEVRVYVVPEVESKPAAKKKPVSSRKR